MLSMILQSQPKKSISCRTRDQSSCEQPRDFSSYAQTTDKWSNPEAEVKPIQINTNPEEKHPRGAENTEPDTPTARPKMIVTVNCTPECSRVKDRPTVRKQSTQQERRHDRMGKYRGVDTTERVSTGA